MIFKGALIADLLDDGIEDPKGFELMSLERDPEDDAHYNTVIICDHGVYYQIEFDDKWYENHICAARDIEEMEATEVTPVEKTITVYEKIL